MRRRFSALAAALLAGFAGAAQAAQTAAPQPLETVIVTANAKGPAIWHATKNGADVAILALVQPLPDGFQWNSRALETILGRVRRVFLPPHIEMGVLSGAWFYLTEGGRLHPPDHQTLWDELDPGIATELERVSALLREPRDEYSDDSPIRAAVRLGSDFRHVYYLTTHEPEDRIAALARAQGVPAHPIANYDLVASGEELLKLPARVAGQCIEAEIRDIDFQSAHVKAAANAWATGDVAGMMANWAPSNYYQCLFELSPHASGIEARSIEDTVKAVNDALAGGGQTLVVVDVGLFLGKDGVLDRLKAAGVAIAGPAT